MGKRINVNGKDYDVPVDESTPLLWVLRDHLDLTGTKFGCGIAQCGACTVHIDGNPVRSCVYPVAAVSESQKVVTIEGLSKNADHPIQQAWLELDTPQCGYCQSGMIMASAALLDSNSNPSDQDINSNITNICRCGTFQRVREGIHLAAKIKAGAKVSGGPIDSPDETSPEELAHYANGQNQTPVNNAQFYDAAATGGNNA